MVKNCICIALGEKPDIVSTINCGSAIRYIKSKIGRIKEINGIESAEKISGIKQVSIVHGIGDYAKEITNSIDRIGFVIAQAATAEEAVKLCDMALERITIKIL